MKDFPVMLEKRAQTRVVHNVLKKRLEEVRSISMRKNGFDMGLIICQEDDLDPVFRTMIPTDTWCATAAIVKITAESEFLFYKSEVSRVETTSFPWEVPLFV